MSDIKETNISRSIMPKVSLVRLKLLFIVSFTTMLCGCSGPWRIDWTYDGKRRPLEDIAVLFSSEISQDNPWILVGRGLIITTIDGEAPKGRKGGGLYPFEVHLLPGKHEICCYRHIIDGPRFLKTNTITINVLFEKGQVYELITGAELYGNEPRWSLGCRKWGSLSKVASEIVTKRKPEPAPFGGTFYSKPPSHWHEVARE